MRSPVECGGSGGDSRGRMAVKPASLELEG